MLVLLYIGCFLVDTYHRCFKYHIILGVLFWPDREPAGVWGLVYSLHAPSPLFFLLRHVLPCIGWYDGILYSRLLQSDAKVPGQSLVGTWLTELPRSLVLSRPSAEMVILALRWVASNLGAIFVFGKCLYWFVFTSREKLCPFIKVFTLTLVDTQNFLCF